MYFCTKFYTLFECFFQVKIFKITRKIFYLFHAKQVAHFAAELVVLFARNNQSKPQPLFNVP